ncbi:MAG TPA: hypothetical protein VIO61_08640 [Anaerolineaceae bacterium]
MYLKLKPDYEQTKQRIDAFWEREIIDRPVVQFHLAKPLEEQVPVPVSHHASIEDRWLDADYQARLALARLSNREYLGDNLPVAFPNLGPEIFSALYGCPLHFGDYGTSWTDPILEDWSQADNLALDWNHPYLKKLDEMTDALLVTGKDIFITGMTDWHPGGDAIAAFRDPQNLAVDMIEHPTEIKRLLARLEQDYFAIYDRFYHKLRAAGLPITSWTPLVSEQKYYIPSNDFSIMVSSRMFREVFLPGIINECRFLDRSIYHLDGPGALRHLDDLLEIKELHGIQYVYGAGNEGFARWVHVYRRIQSAGKCVQVNCRFGEIDQVIETLNPHGLFLNVEGVPSREAAIIMLNQLTRWCAGKST